MTPTDQTSASDPVLARLPKTFVEGLRLTKHMRSDIARGRSIIADGQPVTAVFLISEGWAVSKMSIDTGDTQILDILGPGSFAGITRLEEMGSHDYSAIALQNVSAYRIDIDALHDISAKDETVSRWLSDTLSRQSQRTQRHLTALGQLPARGRLAFAMLRILEVAQQTGDSGLHKTIRLPMTQEEIGNMLGLTNVSISKLMSAFRKEGLIDYGRNRIVVQDANALSEICGMDPEEISDAAQDKASDDISPMSSRSA